MYLYKHSRWYLISFLLVIWILISLQENLIHEGLNILSIEIVSFFKVNPNPSATEYDRLTIFLYNSIYCGLCLIIIHLYFESWQITRLAFTLYLLMFIFTVSLNEMGKVLSFAPFRTTAFRLMTVVVSPFLIVLFIPAIHLSKKLRNGD